MGCDTGSHRPSSDGDREGWLLRTGPTVKARIRPAHCPAEPPSLLIISPVVVEPRPLESGVSMTSRLHRVTMEYDFSSLTRDEATHSPSQSDHSTRCSRPRWLCGTARVGEGSPACQEAEWACRAASIPSLQQHNLVAWGGKREPAEGATEMARTAGCRRLMRRLPATPGC